MLKIGHGKEKKKKKKKGGKQGAAGFLLAHQRRNSSSFLTKYWLRTTKSTVWPHCTPNSTTIF